MRFSFAIHLPQPMYAPASEPQAQRTVAAPEAPRFEPQPAPVRELPQDRFVRIGERALVAAGDADFAERHAILADHRRHQPSVRVVARLFAGQRRGRRMRADDAARGVGDGAQHAVHRIARAGVERRSGRAGGACGSHGATGRP